MKTKELKAKMELAILGAMEKGRRLITGKHEGIDGILVTVGLCIIALLLCVVMKDSMSTFISNIVTYLTTYAKGMLGIS